MSRGYEVNWDDEAWPEIIIHERGQQTLVEARKEIRDHCEQIIRRWQAVKRSLPHKVPRVLAVVELLDRGDGGD